LQKAGHDVQLPVEVGLKGSRDAVHLRHAVREGRLVLTRNHENFEALHELVLEVQGHHPGILTVRQENDRQRDMKLTDIVRAIANLGKAAAPLADAVHVLNQWR
jgi:hypothetical protein